MNHLSNGPSDNGSNANQEQSQHHETDGNQDEGAAQIQNQTIESLSNVSMLNFTTSSSNDIADMVTDEDRRDNSSVHSSESNSGVLSLLTRSRRSSIEFSSTITSNSSERERINDTNNAENNDTNDDVFLNESSDDNREKNAAAKRKEIRSILKNTEWTELEKRLKIQALMDGRVTTSAVGSSSLSSFCRNVPFASTSSSSSLFSGAIDFKTGSSDTVATRNCAHYERNCNIISPCCSKIFGCRICHDEAMQGHHGPLDRYAITYIVCKLCHTKQEKSNKCIKCQIIFAEYYCDICNLWMSKSNKPFHCHKCGLCRVGGQENFRHCDLCCMCISINVSEKDHNCLKEKYKNDCPVCREDMFSSRQPPQDLPCGHAIHTHCFRRLSMYDYRCPICKKNVVSKESMEAAWAARARDIALQPMPPDLGKIVSIVCFDCYEKTNNLKWHLLGVQCPKCNSFNTHIDQNATNSATESDDNNNRGDNNEDTSENGAQSDENNNL